MTGRPPRNLGASIRARLLNLARDQGIEFEYVLRRFANERLLCRIAQSPWRAHLILKGATLFMLWSPSGFRQSRDVDLLGQGIGEADTPRLMHDVFAIDVEPDGLFFLPESLRFEPIRDDMDGGGVRIHVTAALADARIPVQLDLAFGDIVIPEPRDEAFPTLLPEFPAPTLLTYPPEAVVAEKFEAIVRLAGANTRLKDFYDLWVLAQQFEFDGILAEAIHRTFQQRGTAIPRETPVALQSRFTGGTGQEQWRAFLARSDLSAPTLPEVATVIANLVMPAALAAQRGDPFAAHWNIDRGWSA